MRTKLLLLSTMLWVVCLTVNSQAPRLIFSEWAAPANGGWGHHYFELTNVGDSTLHLWDFTSKNFGHWQNINNRNPAHYTLRFNEVVDSMDAFIAPGKSFLISLTYEGVNDIGEPLGRPALNAVSDLLIYMLEDGNEDLEPGEDSVSASTNWFRDEMANNGEWKSLWYHPPGGGDVLCDAINNWINEANGRRFTEGVWDVAGVPDAVATQAFIRKSNITQGDTTWLDWPISAGNDRDESEWMPVPYDMVNAWNPVVFSSAGNHPETNGSSTIQMNSDEVTIDMEAGTITVPWGIRKGAWRVTNSRSQGIFDAITWGEGMAWNYVENGDTATTACQDGDTLNAYAFGTELVHKAFKIIAADASADNALAIPKRAFDSETYMSWLWGNEDGTTPIEDRTLYQPFEITENVPVIDSIRYIPFATRTDSLLAYIEMAPNATYEFVWVDGVERVDLKDGDILRITAEDKSTVKDYYLALEDVVVSANAFLSAITWPDIPEDLGWMGWSGDTIPGFNPAIFSYTVTVPFGTSNVPALSYIKENLNSTVVVDRAKTLRGSREDRTTTITVSSQDTTMEDGVVNVYMITFEAEVLEEDIQPYHATPIISEVLYRHMNIGSFIEIANVGNQPINLENYMIMVPLAAGTPDATLQLGAGPDSTDWVFRYSKYIPGYKYGSLEEWRSGGLNAKLKPDLDIETTLDPGKTFVLGMLHPNMLTDPTNHVQENQVNVHWSTEVENHMGELCMPWPPTGGWRSTVPYTAQYNPIMIFEVQNDSIYDASKGIYDIEDFELVDLFGAYTFSAWDVGDGNLANNNDDYRKKPHAWRPNLEENGGFEDARDWYHYWQGQPGDGARNPVEMKEDIGNYSFDPITVYMSTVASAAYLVDPGYEGDLDIVGVITGSTVEEVFTNISKADTGQVLSVISSGTGLELDSADLVANGDTLMVVSADQNNMTKYVLAVATGGLDNDAVLTPKDGSGLTIANTAETGTIEGVTPGMNISDVLAKVESPATATLNIIDADGNLVPLKFLNPDTVMVPTQVLGEIYFESVAQDQKTIITYELVLDISDSEAWVSSNVYGVNQERKIISHVPEGVTAQVFLANLIPGGDATIELMDIVGQSREEGYVVKDDMLKVTSKDESVSVVYTLRFLGAALSTAAYVTSEVYTVGEDQISQIPAYTAVEAFMANLVPAPASVVMLTDGSDAPKTEGEVVTGDKVVVTAEDDVTTKTYTVDVLVSVRDLVIDRISLYPNPTDNVLYLSEVPAGCTIRLVSITGQTMRVIKTESDLLELSVEDLAKGYYLIRVVDRDQNSRIIRFVKN
ncbi:MAG: T9SS type A sorting domain-containing protein [Bacteroidetes bacterium]|nr:T9SS type A sorting domain-containing protein [Bacteroidota bacterium]